MSMCSFVIAGTFAVLSAVGSEVVLGKLHAGGVPVVIDIGAPPSICVGGAPMF
jgi:hypothetical protein